MNYFIIKANCEHNFQISSSHTHMSKHIWEISAVNKYNSLYICWDLFFSINFFTKKHSSSLVSLVHNFFQMLDMLNIAAATM